MRSIHLTRAGVAIWRGAVLAAAVILVSVTWLSVHANQKLAASNALLIKTRSFPWPLTALRLEVPGTKLISVRAARQRAAVEKYLVLVTARSCPFCTANSTNWEKLLHSIPSPGAIAVWEIGYGGSPGEDWLRQSLPAGVAYRLVEVTEPVLFSLRTGLSATPSTLLLDENMKPILVQEGVMSPTILQLFERGLQGNLEPVLDPFLPPGQAQAEGRPGAIAGARDSPKSTSKSAHGGGA